MSQQLSNGYVTPAGPGLIDIGIGGIQEHPLLFKLGQILADLVIDIEQLLFRQHHDCCTGNLPGHRIHPEQRVVHHRPIALDVELTKRFEIDNAAVPGHCRHHPGNVTGVDVLLQPGRGAVQQGTGQAYLFRRGESQVLAHTGTRPTQRSQKQDQQSTDAPPFPSCDSAIAVFFQKFLHYAVHGSVHCSCC